MGGVVRGNHINGAVQNPFYQGLPVCPAPKGRVHLEAALLLQIFIAEQEVVGGSFAAHIDALFPGLPHQGHAFLRGNMADMISAARFPGQPDIPFDGPPLAFRGDAPVAMSRRISAIVDIAAVKQAFILAMGRQNLSQAGAALHQAPHHGLALDALAVIGKSADIRGHGFQLRRLPAQLAQGQSAVGQHLDNRPFPDQGKLFLQMLQAVRHRI